MFDSIHSARWLSQFRDQEIDFLLFPSSPHRRVHTNLKQLLTSTGAASYRSVSLSNYFALPFWVLDKFLGNALRGSIAKLAINSFKPSIVHAMELQNAGYTALRALKGRKPEGLKLITTNWGSDIFWFQKFPQHKKKLQDLLAISDFHSAECNRDLALATKLGFAGEFMPVIPNAGGFSQEQLDRQLPSSKDRGVIAIKGYDGWVGRAKVALEAIADMHSELGEFDLVVYSANATTVQKAKELEKNFGVTFEVNSKGSLSHSEVLNLFANAQIYVGLSESDGISTSLLEAMAMGAIPVQTATACCDEWFSETGVAVQEISVPSVQLAIRRALELAQDQSNADANRETIRRKASAEEVSKIAQGFYNI